MEKRARIYYKGNRLQQLRAFCHAAWLGSLHKAASALFLHQPTLSLQIQALERELGVCLFERTNRGVTLTPAGKLLLELAEPVLDGIDSLAQAFHEKRMSPWPQLVGIAVSHMSVRRVLPDVLAAFLKSEQGVHLRVFGRRLDEIIDMLVNERVDLGFGPYYELPSELDFLPCVHYDMVVITRPDHPFVGRHVLRPKDVAEQPLVLCEADSLQNKLVVEWLKTQRLAPHIVMETSEWDVIFRHVQLGLGVGLVSEGWIDDDTRAKLHVMPFSEFFGTRTYGVLLKHGRHISAPAQRLVRHIQRAFV